MRPPASAERIRIDRAGVHGEAARGATVQGIYAASAAHEQTGPLCTERQNVQQANDRAKRGREAFYAAGPETGYAQNNSDAAEQTRPVLRRSGREATGFAVLLAVSTYFGG